MSRAPTQRRKTIGMHTWHQPIKSKGWSVFRQTGPVVRDGLSPGEGPRAPSDTPQVKKFELLISTGFANVYKSYPQLVNA
jgi:hypothetical protein